MAFGMLGPARVASKAPMQGRSFIKEALLAMVRFRSGSTSKFVGRDWQTTATVGRHQIIEGIPEVAVLEQPVCR